MADFIQEQGSTASFEGNQYVELAGTSQETKPTGDFLSGSVFVEVDTGKVFLYDRGSSEWHEIAGSGGGGGGGSSGGGVFVVHATENEAGTALVLDKTWQEIHDGVDSSGCAVIFWPPDNGQDLNLSYVFGIRCIPAQTPGTYRYSVVAMDGIGLQMNVYTYITNSADGYPEMQLGG